jgi:hypothetical protein
MLISGTPGRAIFLAYFRRSDSLDGSAQRKTARMVCGRPCSPPYPSQALRRNMTASTMITMTTTVPRPMYMADSSPLCR